MIEYSLKSDEIKNVILKYYKEYVSMDSEKNINDYKYAYSECRGKNINDFCLLLCFSDFLVNNDYEFSTYFNEYYDNMSDEKKNSPFGIWYQKDIGNMLVIIMNIDIIISNLFDYYRETNIELKENNEKYFGRASWLFSDTGEMEIKLSFVFDEE